MVTWLHILYMCLTNTHTHTHARTHTFGHVHICIHVRQSYTWRLFMEYFKIRLIRNVTGKGVLGFRVPALSLNILPVKLSQ
jgi:hypothetical protein